MQMAKDNLNLYSHRQWQFVKDICSQNKQKSVLAKVQP